MGCLVDKKYKNENREDKNGINEIFLLLNVLKKKVKGVKIGGFLKTIFLPKGSRLYFIPSSF